MHIYLGKWKVFVESYGKRQHVSLESSLVIVECGQGWKHFTWACWLGKSYSTVEKKAKSDGRAGRPMTQIFLATSLYCTYKRLVLCYMVHNICVQCVLYRRDVFIYVSVAKSMVRYCSFLSRVMADREMYECDWPTIIAPLGRHEF